MAKLKTQPHNASVEEFLTRVENEPRKKDAFEVLELMKRVTGEEPVMWGASIIGFGSYHYKYASGREGDWLAAGFSPRKQALTLYITSGFDEHDDLLTRLGRHRTGKSCLYVKRLTDIDMDVLAELVRLSVKSVSASRDSANDG